MAAIYLLPIVFRLYFREPVLTADDKIAAEGREAPASMLVPLVIVTLLTIALGLGAQLSGMPVSLARMAAETFFH
ncbi:MAG: oxidoreductase, partial [Coriobacteriia bacterium]|nr:oxidoreductase [Coriobacteriia bacterium]